MVQTVVYKWLCISLIVSDVDDNQYFYFKNRTEGQ